MRFIPAVSGVQIPPLLPEYDRKPGNFPGFFCYGLFCRVSRDAGQRPARPAGPSWKGRATGCPGQDRLLEDFRIRPLFEDCCGPGIGTLPGAFRQGKGARRRFFRPGPLREFFSLPGENTEKACQRRASSVDASLRCGKSTDVLWQGSSVGQSMRFIPAVSGVQIPPLLPEAHKRFGSVPDRFFVMGCICEHCGAKCSILLRSAFFYFLHVLGTLGCRKLPVRTSA